MDDMEPRGRNDEIWCLGDVVGYGPEPHACIELLRRYNHIYVAGNHDWAAIGKIDISDFNLDAARACQWTPKQLSKDDVAYLQNLPDKVNPRRFHFGAGKLPPAHLGSIYYRWMRLAIILAILTRNFVL